MINNDPLDLLYFEDGEIEKEKINKKQVFVTKRINGKKTSGKETKKNKKRQENNQNNNEKNKFDFDNEIVIGVNKVLPKEELKKKEKNKKTKKSKHSKISKKTKKIKKKKKVNKYKKTIIQILVLTFFIIAGIIFTLVSPIFNIKEIEVNGNSKVSNESIISLSQLKLDNNIFKYNSKQTEENIKQNSYIEEVQIKRNLPKKVEIIVKEREIAYQIKLIDSYVYIDKKGNILENSTLKNGIIILEGISTKENNLIQSNNQKLEDEDLDKLASIGKIIDATDSIEITNLITSINIQDKNDYKLYLANENKTIYLGGATNLTNKMLYIKSMLENEKGNSGAMILNGDFNNGFKPYFKPE